MNKLEELRKKIEQEVFRFEGKDLHITITIGVKEYDNALNYDAWISVADERLYYGKKHGKNQLIKGDTEQSPVS